MSGDNLEEFDLLGGVPPATAQALNVPTPTHVECEECGKLVARDEWDAHRCGFEDRAVVTARPVAVLPPAPEKQAVAIARAQLLSVRNYIDERLNLLEKMEGGK